MSRRRSQTPPETAAGCPPSGERGFTLIELLITVAILGVIATIAVSALLNALDRAKQRSTMADMRTISRAIEAYEVDHGYLPSDAGGVAGLTTVLIPYQINVVPQTDHWGNTYVYSVNNSDYSLESYGRDGLDGANITLATRFDFNLDIIVANGAFVASPE